MADAIDLTWPIEVASVRKALKYSAEQGDDEDLLLYAVAASQRVDLATGRDVEAHRHEDSNGDVPVIFILAARRIAALWWQQANNGPRGLPSAAGDQPAGPPMGADLPRQVEGWLDNYPPPPGFGQPIAEPDEEP